MKEFEFQVLTICLFSCDNDTEHCQTLLTCLPRSVAREQVQWTVFAPGVVVVSAHEELLLAEVAEQLPGRLLGHHPVLHPHLYGEGGAGAGLGQGAGVLHQQRRGAEDVLVEVPLRPPRGYPD